MEKLIRLVRGYLNEEEWSDTHEAAISLITRIGKAVLSGEYPELDELLGVAGRLEQEPQTRPYARGVELGLKGWILNHFKEGARTFIAFCPEEGNATSGKASQVGTDR